MSAPVLHRKRVGWGRAAVGGVLALALLATSGARAASARDPLEGFNRSMFSFNESLDEWVLRPLAEGYQKVVPELVRTGVRNVFGNIEDMWSVVNHVLQGKPEEAGVMGMRVVTNTVLGFGGLLDWASEMGMERQSEDLGQTLGRWGVPSGPYLVLPVFGPSTVRDAAALPVDKMAGPTLFISGLDHQVEVTLLQAVSVRAGLLSASSMLNDIALDKYVFMRDAYLTRRQNQVYDGNPPEPAENAEEAEAPSPAASSAQ